MTLEEIRAYIDADREEYNRRAKMYEYYKNNNAILTEPKKDDDKPDNRLCHGFAAYIANAYTGYMMGQPVTYAAKSEDGETDETAERLMETLTDCYDYNDEQAENTELELDLAICGVAVELVYVDTEGMVRFARVNPVGCVAVTDGTLENGLEALIRYYDTYSVTEKKAIRTVEVYDREQVTVYRSEGTGSLTMESQSSHYFGDVPAIVYHNGPFDMGDAEGVISLIDAYDRMQSDGVNDQQYFTDAFLVLNGIGEMDEDDVSDMKRRRVLAMPEGSSANWLIKSQSDATPQNIKDRLNADIHRFSCCPDMSDENFAGNASGVALSYKLLQFENVARIKERGFKKGLQRRLELLCNIWQVKGARQYDWRSIRITFHRALPQNLLELSQTVSTLGQIISDETKRELLPLDIDEATEKKRLEGQYAGSLFTMEEYRTGSVIPEETEETDFMEE